MLASPTSHAAGSPVFARHGSFHPPLDAVRRAIQQLALRPKVVPADIDALRRLGVGTDCLSREEADALFRLEGRVMPKCREWEGFFVDAITDHCVWDLRPTGVVNESQGEWLIASADRAATPGAFSVLAEVLAVAHRVPMWFTAAVRSRAVQGWPCGRGIAAAANFTGDIG